MTMASRMKEARARAGLTQRALAIRAGISQPTLSDLESGKTQGSGATAILASILNVNALWLAEGRGPQWPELPQHAAARPHNQGWQTIPLIAWKHAAGWSGSAAYARLHANDIEAWMPFAAQENMRCFALQVSGESMCNPDGEPTFYHHDRIIVDPARQAGHHSIIVVQMPGAPEAVLRQLIIEGSRRYLKTLNPVWPERIAYCQPDATICGVVIGKHVSYD